MNETDIKRLTQQFSAENHKVEDNARHNVVKKYTMDDWSLIESAVVSSDDLMLFRILESYTLKSILANTSVNINDKSALEAKIDEPDIKKLKVLGNHFYGDVRIKLKQKFTEYLKNINTDVDITNDTKTKDTKSKNKKKITATADEIRKKNASTKVADTVDVVLATFSMENLTPQTGFKSDIIEIRGMTFMYIMCYMMKNRDKGKYSGSKYSEVLNLMVSVQRYINACRDYIGTDMVTPNAMTTISLDHITDLKVIYDQMLKMYPFNGYDIIQKVPKLIIWSDFDQYIPSKGFAPRGHQINLINQFIKDFDKGKLVQYTAMIGSGKTTAVIMIATLVRFLRKHEPAKYEHLQMIFCCNLESVKRQVAIICYNSDIEFALGYVKIDGTLKISNSFMCKNKVPLVVICSPDVAHIMLSDRTKDPLPYQRYILYHDEPTQSADIAGSMSLRENVMIMRNPPKWCIESSATLPDINQLTPIISHVKSVNPQIHIYSVTSSEIQIGCDVKSFSGDYVVPYIGCKTGKELKEIIKNIRLTPFIGRMLTSNIAMTLWKLGSDLNITNFPDIPSKFADISNLKADKVRETILEMLDIFSNESNAVIEKVCESKIFENDVKVQEKKPKPKEDENMGFEWDDDESEESQMSQSSQIKQDYINFQKLGTTDAYKCPTLTLIACLNPFEFATTNFQELLLLMAEDGVKSASRILEKYHRETNTFNEMIEKMKRNNKDTEDKLSQKIQEQEESKPTIDFPTSFQIKTKNFYKKFSDKLDKTDLVMRNVNSLETIDGIDDMNVADHVKLLLFAGVGIYSPTNKNTECPIYQSCVLKLASEGKLAYLVADNSISYGTNYPIGVVMICDDFSNIHSIYTLFQLMGRAGRVGQSWKAEAYIGSDMAKKLIDYTLHPERYDIEAQNINNMVEILKTEEEDKLQSTIDKLEAEALKEVSAGTIGKIEFISNQKPKPTPVKVEPIKVEEKPTSKVEEKPKGKPIVRENYVPPPSKDDSKKKPNANNTNTNTSSNVQNGPNSWRRK